MSTKFYFYTENSHILTDTSVSPKLRAKLQNPALIHIAELAKESQLPPHRLVQRLGWRGEFSKHENVFYFYVDKFYPTTMSAIKCCVIYHRTCVVFTGAYRLQFNSFESPDYQLLAYLESQHKREYIDELQRKAHLTNYLLAKGTPANVIKSFGATSQLFQPEFEMYAKYNISTVTGFSANPKSTVFQSLCYCYDLPITIASQRDPLDVWAKTLPTTYAPHELTEEWFDLQVDPRNPENYTLKRIEEVKSSPDELFYKPRQEGDAVEFETAYQSVIWYLEHGIPFAKRPVVEHPLPRYIQLHDLVVDTYELFPPMTPQEQYHNDYELAQDLRDELGSLPEFISTYRFI